MFRNRAVIEFTLTHEGCTPTQAYDGDVGWDLYVAKPMQLLPFTPVDVPCGFNMALPKGYWARITGRSSTIRKHRIMVNDAVIDAGYRGPLFVCMTSLNPDPINVKVGWRLSQLIIHKVEPVKWVNTIVLSPSERGEQGFGSSGS